jgi:hypothetical protein
MLDFHKNYQLNSEKNSNNNDDYFNINRYSKNTNKNNFFQKFSVLSDKNNSSENNILLREDKIDTYYKFNNNSNLFSNQIFYFNSNNTALGNFDNNNLSNKNIPGVEIRDLYYNFNSKISSSMNYENDKNEDIIKPSRKNSRNLNNKNRKSSNNINHNINNYKTYKNIQRKSNSFKITKNYTDENKQKSKEILNNSKIDIYLDSIQEKINEQILIYDNNKIFHIKKLTKQEKEKEKIKEFEKQKIDDTEEDNNLKGDNEKSFYLEYNSHLYNTEFFEKANFNDSTIKALISLRKLSIKKTSVDLTNSNLNKNQTENNIIEEKNKYEKQISDLENSIISESNENKENNDQRKFKYSITKERRKSTIKNDYIFNEKNKINDEDDKEFSVSILKEKISGESVSINKNISSSLLHKNSSELNIFRKESSLQTEYTRKNSFIITKEKRRKETILTSNGCNLSIKKKLSIDETYCNNKNNENDNNNNVLLKIKKFIIYLFILINY